MLAIFRSLLDDKKHKGRCVPAFHNKLNCVFNPQNRTQNSGYANGSKLWKTPFWLPIFGLLKLSWYTISSVFSGATCLPLLKLLQVQCEVKLGSSSLVLMWKIVARICFHSHVEPDRHKGGKELIVASTHLFWDPRWPHVKACQVLSHVCCVFTVVLVALLTYIPFPDYLKRLKCAWLLLRNFNLSFPWTQRLRWFCAVRFELPLTLYIPP